jgi:diguanylate cyclase (GGDEF)-like protein
VVVLPESTLNAAVTVAERIRELIANYTFQFEGKSFHLTISVGVASTQGDDALTPAELIRRADDRLYQAKRDGRNRVVA